ncbi:DUF5994 family protein [Amycolatopsis sp.]|uniref:DUF5994 family protein n=1 Tax=Amycolatopsis sp. TaxID=37632 RepID=UPI002B91D8F9|nr:DUF5994 family protein [Amycolatopsis sp.]HVV08335.1 DUF5994 family protein [Amycolatopsis sp.]
MTSSPHTLITAPPAATVIEQSRRSLRLQLKPEAPSTGYVDGAWWPRSRDLAAELPALLAVLAGRPGRIERVTYNLTSWQAAGRRLSMAGGADVRLEGFRSQHADTVTISGQGRQRLTLLVVPPETPAAVAHRVLSQAAHWGNTATVASLLAPIPTASTPPDVVVTMDLATDRWEVDGGRIP